MKRHYFALLLNQKFEFVCVLFFVLRHLHVRLKYTSRRAPVTTGCRAPVASGSTNCFAHRANQQDGELREGRGGVLLRGHGSPLLQSNCHHCCYRWAGAPRCQRIHPSPAWHPGWQLSSCRRQARRPRHHRWRRSVPAGAAQQFREHMLASAKRSAQ